MLLFNEGTPDGSTATSQEGTQDNVETSETKTETTQETVDPKEERNKILRDLSKEYGVNLFEPEGLKAFKEFQESQKTEQEKMQEQLSAYQEKEAQWQKTQLEYESKLKASELGIDPKYMEDALKLADNDPSKLADVVKKYPAFKTKEGIRIGVQSPDQTNTPTDLSETERYILEHYGGEQYKRYIKNKK